MQFKMLEIAQKVLLPYGIPEPTDLRRELPRNELGQQWRKRHIADIRGMVWHQALANGSVEAIAGYHTGRDSHLYPGGVESIAYTFAIRKDGQIVLCNNLDKVTWSQGDREHPGDENELYISVLFEGLLTNEVVDDPDAGEPTLEQIISGITLWKVVKAFLKLEDDALFGHADFGKSACPGSTLQAIIRANSANTSGTSSLSQEIENKANREIEESVATDMTVVEEDEFFEEKSGAPIPFMEQSYHDDDVEPEEIHEEPDTVFEDEPTEIPQYDLTTVEARQQALALLGYYRGIIDGIWGPQSSAAFTFFQNSAGIRVDGIWGPESENAMNSFLNSIV